MKLSEALANKLYNCLQIIVLQQKQYILNKWNN